MSTANLHLASVNFELRQLPSMTTPCWEWSKHRSDKGYGIIKMKGKNEYVHRLMFRLFVGHIAHLQVIRHECDNPPCCNPAHLRRGTPAENIADCCAKFRHSFGEKTPRARLTDIQVAKMRKDYSLGTCSQHGLARKYGVCRSTIRSALYGLTWLHVEGALCPRKE